MENNERFNLRSLYLYLVCLVALVIAIFAAVNLVQAAVGLLYPDPGYFGYPVDVKSPEITDAERQQIRDAAVDSQRRSEVLSLVGSATTLAIAGPVYLYHWRRVQRERHGSTPPPGNDAAVKPSGIETV